MQHNFCILLNSGFLWRLESALKAPGTSCPATKLTYRTISLPSYPHHCHLGAFPQATEALGPCRTAVKSQGDFCNWAAWDLNKTTNFSGLCNAAVCNDDVQTVELLIPCPTYLLKCIFLGELSQNRLETNSSTFCSNTVNCLFFEKVNHNIGTQP